MNESGLNRDISLMVATFNMGNAPCNDIDKLIPSKGEGLDLIVLGLQESTWLGKMTTPVKTTKNILEPCVEELLSAIRVVLGEEFKMVAHNKRAQLQMIIFAREALAKDIHNIAKSAENTG